MSKRSSTLISFWLRTRTWNFSLSRSNSPWMVTSSQTVTVWPGSSDIEVISEPAESLKRESHTGLAHRFGLLEGGSSHTDRRKGSRMLPSLVITMGNLATSPVDPHCSRETMLADISRWAATVTVISSLT